MHYAVLVVLPKDEARGTSLADVTERLNSIMDDHYEDRWDWFVIGGRYTGRLDGYNPETDPANTEVCSLCKGTGKREPLEGNDFSWCDGCNGCRGKGVAVKWPTAWRQHPGDIMPAEKLTAEHLEKFYAVVADGDWHEGGITIDWLKQQGDVAVVVDCHN